MYNRLRTYEQFQTTLQAINLELAERDASLFAMTLESLNALEYQFYDNYVSRYRTTSPFGMANPSDEHKEFITLFNLISNVYLTAFGRILDFIDVEMFPRVLKLLEVDNDMQGMVEDTPRFLANLYNADPGFNLAQLLTDYTNWLSTYARRYDFLTLHIFRQFSWYSQIAMHIWSEKASLRLPSDSFVNAPPMVPNTKESSLLTMKTEPGQVLQEIVKEGILKLPFATNVVGLPRLPHLPRPAIFPSRAVTNVPYLENSTVPSNRVVSTSKPTSNMSQSRLRNAYETARSIGSTVGRAGIAGAGTTYRAARSVGRGVGAVGRGIASGARATYRAAQERPKAVSGAAGALTAVGAGLAAYPYLSDIAKVGVQQWATAVDNVSDFVSGGAPPPKGVLDTALDGLYDAVSAVSGNPYVSGAVGLGLGLTGLGAYLYSRRRSPAAPSAARETPSSAPSKPSPPSAASTASAISAQPTKRVLPKPVLNRSASTGAALQPSRLMSPTQRLQLQQRIARSRAAAAQQARSTPRRASSRARGGSRTPVIPKRGVANSRRSPSGASKASGRSPSHRAAASTRTRGSRAMA